MCPLLAPGKIFYNFTGHARRHYNAFRQALLDKMRGAMVRHCCEPQAGYPWPDARSDGMPMSFLITFFGLCCSLLFFSPTYAADFNPSPATPAGNAPSPAHDYAGAPHLDGDSHPPHDKYPGETVEQLASRANDWHEPSLQSEKIYINAIRQWLATLPPMQRALTRRILRDAHPAMQSLRMAIREKKAQLASLSFDHDTKPEALPRLGQELQQLRRSLKQELQKLGDRLQREAGVSMGPLGGDSFWLAPPPANKPAPQKKASDPHTQLPRSSWSFMGQLSADYKFNLIFQ